MSTPSSSVGVTTIDDIDEFTLPGAEDVLSSPASPTPPKRSIFSRDDSVDLSFLDKPETKPAGGAAAPDASETEPPVDPGKPAPAISEDSDDILKSLDPTEDNLDAADPAKPTTKTRGARPLTDVSVIQKLADQGRIVLFDDGKPLEEYTGKDLEELLTANLEEIEKRVRQEVPLQFFDALPAEMQKAAQYLMDGGSDLKSMFKALSHVQEVRELDASKEPDQIQIIRQYLQATDWGTDDQIDEEISTYKDLGTLGKRATQMKPKLDKMQEEIVDHQIRQQEQARLQQEQARHAYVENIYNALAPGKINGIPLDKRTQQQLYQDLTTTRHQGMNGKPTNLLGHLLEQHQFIKPRFDLIVEATMLLSDPEAYRERIRSQGRVETTVETVRALKTEQGRKPSSGSPQTIEEEAKPAKRTLPRQRNIFER